MPSGRGSRAAIDTQSRFRKQSALNAEMVSSHKRVKDSPHGKEFDTYKISTSANSTSTMHKLASTPITLECFETESYNYNLPIDISEDNTISMAWGDFIECDLIPFLEKLRQTYLATNDKQYWKELIRWLPEGWLQTRTWTANYEVLRSMYFQRKAHKLTEWDAFCKWVESLPYAKELITYNG